MTRFVHDQFAKDLLEDLLKPWGEVKPAHKVGAEVREIDVWFSPHPELELPIATLGLLGRFAMQPASFEPFRNAANEDEICDCLLKLLVLRGKTVRDAKRDKVRVERSALPKLWVMTPTASRSLLDRFAAQPDRDWPSGVYFLSTAFRTAIVVIHQLPKTPETLWLRILGRGKVQQQAIDELEALPMESPFRANALALLLNLRVILETREQINRDDRELIMRLSPLYQQRIEEATQQGIQQGLLQGIQQGVQQGIQQGVQQGIQQGVQQGIQQGVQQGIQQGVQQGIQQGETLVIQNLLKVRFGALDDRFNVVIESLLKLSPEEFTPLLLNLSQEELIDRFGQTNPER